MFNIPTPKYPLLTCPYCGYGPCVEKLWKRVFIEDNRVWQNDETKFANCPHCGKTVAITAQVVLTARKAM